jgi:hypothetical protein
MKKIPLIAERAAACVWRSERERRGMWSARKTIFTQPALRWPWNLVQKWFTSDWLHPCRCAQTAEAIMMLPSMLIACLMPKSMVCDHRSKISLVLPDRFSSPLQNGQRLFCTNSNSYSSSKKNFPHSLQFLSRIYGAMLMKYRMGRVALILRWSMKYMDS